MPPLRVLGLTGPVASGCTSLSRLFDSPGRPRHEPNYLLKILLERDKVVVPGNDGGFRISWEAINEKISQLSHEHSGGIPWEQVPPSKSDDVCEIPEPLLDELEHREALHSLADLFEYYRPEGHLFRTLSMSDTIVFHALMALESRGWSASAVAKVYERFSLVAVKEAKALLDIFHKRIQVGSLTEYYTELHREQDEEGIHKLCRALGWIHAIAKRVKDAFRETEPEVYTKSLQDFGDNLRRCGDPFDTGTDIRSEYSVLLVKDIARMITLHY